MKEVCDQFGSKHQLLGAGINALTIPIMLDAFKFIVEEDKKKSIVYHNMHSVYLINKYPRTKEYWQQADLAFLDSVPLLWWAKFIGHSFKNEHRITFIDWLHPLLNLSNEEGWRVFYLGSKPGVPQKAKKVINTTYNKIHFNYAHGFFNAESDSGENKKIVEAINAFRPHILLVGMGMPRQEKWIAENMEQLNANAILGCGAGLEFITGDQKIPPRFLAKLGLEWFYRFLCDPARLFKRYFIEPLWLIPVFLKDFQNRSF